MLAGFATEQGYKSAYILTSPNSAYTLKLPQYFGQAFTAKGGTLLGEGSFAMGQQDFQRRSHQDRSDGPKARCHHDSGL